MRTTHADLITAQQSGAANPYIYLYINSTDYSSRLISLEHREESYRDTAVIVFANSDRHFNATANDLRGKFFSPGYGYTDANSINRYLGDGADVGYNPAMPRMWVKTQSMVSLEGELVCILYCEGEWGKLREITVASISPNLYISGLEPPYFNIPFTATQTVYQLIEKALNEAGFILTALGTQDDGIINAFSPIFTANPLTYESLASIIYRLIEMTKCYLRPVDSLSFKVIYPQEADAVNETYYSDQKPYFREYTEKLNLLIPNHIVVFCNRELDGTWKPANMFIGNSYDSDQFTGTTYTGSYTEVTEFHIAPYIDNPTDADNRAAAILQRYKNETLAGRLVLPFHDCRVELYDKVSIYDGRG